MTYYALQEHGNSKVLIKRYGQFFHEFSNIINNTIIQPPVGYLVLIPIIFLNKKLYCFVNRFKYGIKTAKKGYFFGYICNCTLTV